MLTVLLYLSLGPRAALAEIMIGLSLLGGGKGKRILSTPGVLLEQMRTRRLASRRAPRPRPAWRSTSSCAGRTRR